MRRLVPRRLPPGVLLVSGAAVLAVAALAVPAETADRLEVPARVLAAREWTVVRSADGAVEATLRDHRTGAVEATFAAAPERGDAARFRLRLDDGRTVEAGDAVGEFVSGEAAVRASRLAGDVRAAEAEVRFYRSGQKAPLVEAARQEVARAQAAREQAARVVARQEDLVERGVGAARDLEAAQARETEAEAELAVAEARLEAVQTGSRAEEVALAEARLAALRRESAALGDRLRMNTLVAPISGTAFHVVSPDTLLLVADTSELTVVLPVRWADRDRVRPGQTVRLRASEWGEPARARIVGLRETSAQAAGQAYLLASAEVTAGREALTPGLLVLAAVELDPVPTDQRLRRLWSDLFGAP
jgi:hypothetical protein